MPFPTAIAVLANLAAGEIRLATSPSVDDTVSRLTTLAPDELRGGRVVMLVWDRLPPHSFILDEAIDQLAQAALALWPEWYLAEPSFDGADSTVSSLAERMRSAGLGRYVLTHWLRLADKACRTKRAPRWEKEFTSEVECRQLALALGEQACRLVLAVRAADQDDAALRGLARAAEWLARETRMPLLVLVPADFGDSTELDSISFGKVALAGEAIPDLVPLEPKAKHLAQPAQLEHTPRRQTTPRRSRLIVRPLIGRPHPDSAGEQLLWDKLQSDPELAGLFLCNQWATTLCNTTYLVDFVWVIGKLVVEVDGYYWHSSHFSFAYDRRRDYELQLSGHLVMRLPHDEVIADVENAVEKIRRMVHLRQQT